jgi:hypothetical protein
MNEFRVEVSNNSSSKVIKESFLNEDAALEFAESFWLQGLEVAVFRNDDLYCEYEV